MIAADPAATVAFDAPDLREGAAAPVDLRLFARRSDVRGAVRFAAHLGCIGATGCLVWLALPVWPLLVPAMLLHGLAIVTMFAPLHECVHRTAFASPRLNDAIGWVAGVLSFYNATYYRHFHAWHHRYTQDPGRDPELMYPKAAGFVAYVTEISGVTFWLRRALDYPRLALGLVRLPFIPENARRPIALSMSCQLLIYLCVGLSLLVSSAALWFWLLPALLAQPLLRAILIAEHTGCSTTRDGFENTRTTLTVFPIRFLMWNMPFHAEHHLHPAVPFYRLPLLHRQLRDRLVHLAPGYAAVNRSILRTLSPSS
jgi:fatty acid desaturase